VDYMNWAVYRAFVRREMVIEYVPKIVETLPVTLFSNRIPHATLFVKGFATA